MSDVVFTVIKEPGRNVFSVFLCGKTLLFDTEVYFEEYYWHHLAIALDVNEGIRLYFDGKLIHENTNRKVERNCYLPQGK